MTQPLSVGEKLPAVLIDRLTVKFRVWDEARIEEVVRAVGGTIRVKIPAVRWVEVVIDPAAASDLHIAYENHPEVEDVFFPEGKAPRAITYHAATNDPMVPFQQGLRRMNVFHAWKYTRGAGAIGAAYDGGFSFRTAPEFTGKTFGLWNSHYNAATVTIYDDNNVPSELDVVQDGKWGAHGDSVLGTIAANAGDGIGPAGIAPDASPLVMVTGLESQVINPHYNGSTTDADDCNGLIEAFALFGAKAVNYSAGDGANSTMTPTQFLAARPLWRDTLIYLRDNGVVVCGAAGNDSADDRSGTYSYPEFAFPSLGHLSVGCLSYEELDRPVFYSSVGNYVNVATPGHTNWSIVQVKSLPCAVDIPPGWKSEWGDMEAISSRQIAWNYEAFNGTSDAAPMCTGVVTLVLAANPALSGQDAAAIVLATGDAGQHPAFLANLPNAVVPNAARAVLKALSLVPANAGVVWPYVNFFGRGVTVEVSGGVATTKLHGAVSAEIDGFSSDPITNVELWADADLIYSGAPATSRTGTLVPLASARLAGKSLRVVASTAGMTASQTFSDIVGYAVSSIPPHTTATPPPTASIALSAQSENPPVRISYRWGSGAWQTYSTPFPSQTGTLQFYGVDSLGNVEGGTDYANL